jgi:predicted transcriptional regulator
MPGATKTLTIRLPIELYRASSEIARRRCISLNRLVQQGLTAVSQEEEDARLYEAFGQLGEDVEEADVEYAAHARWEVIRRGDT